MSHFFCKMSEWYVKLCNPVFSHEDGRRGTADGISPVEKKKKKKKPRCYLIISYRAKGTFCSFCQTWWGVDGDDVDVANVRVYHNSLVEMH